MWIVVGGDGLIGSRLAAPDERSPHRVVPTSRRSGAAPGTLHADLAVADFREVVDAGPSVVFLCAAMTGMKACEDDPALAHRVNVSAPVELAAALIERGAFVLFLSSNTVFDCQTGQPDESSMPSPANAYGRQKAEAERRLREIPGADRRLAIVRLSKVLEPDAGMPASFRRKLAAGETCAAFDDLLMSPVSVQYVVDGLREVARRELPGIFHLSGAAVVSYAEFARELARRCGWEVSLVHAASSLSVGASVPFRPRYPALGMQTTSERLGCRPQSLEDFWQDFLGEAPTGAMELRR